MLFGTFGGWREVLAVGEEGDYAIDLFLQLRDSPIIPSVTGHIKEGMYTYVDFPRFLRCVISGTWQSSFIRKHLHQASISIYYHR